MSRMTQLLVLAIHGGACSAPPPDARSESPGAGDSSATSGSANDAAPSRPTQGCRFAERILRQDENFEEWPAPEELAKSVNHSYSGRVDWHEPDIRPAEDIVVDIGVDPSNVVLRYPTSPPRPNEPIVCSSSLVVPIKATLHMGAAEAEVSALDVVWSFPLVLNAELPKAFASGFANEHADGYNVYLEIKLDGSALYGSFNLSKAGATPRRPAEFVAR
jgi:hypothetical protein